jgi:hypothetical protein
LISRLPVAAVAALVLTVLALGGCGGGGEETTAAATTQQEATTTAPRPRAYVAAANGVCRQMLRETRRLGRDFIAEVAASPEHDLLGSMTEGLISPGVTVLSRIAARLRAVEAKYPDPALSVYVGLYEPLLQLARLRLSAGEAEDFGEAKNLETQMEQIGTEQRLAARRAGLRDCGVDFLHALVSSWSTP